MQTLGHFKSLNFFGGLWEQIPRVRSWAQTRRPGRQQDQSLLRLQSEFKAIPGCSARPYLKTKHKKVGGDMA